MNGPNLSGVVGTDENLIRLFVVAAHVLTVAAGRANFTRQMSVQVNLAAGTLQSRQHELDHRHFQTIQDVVLTDLFRRGCFGSSGHLVENGVSYPRASPLRVQVGKGRIGR